MTPDRKLELAVQAKTRGNHLFKEANHSGALAEYAQVRVSPVSKDLATAVLVQSKMNRR